MFKIGEFSKLTQVSIRMLRYYDEVGLLKPADIDKFTGYRYYSVEQIPLLHKIIFLRDTGFQVAEISAVVQNWNETAMINFLNNKHSEIEASIKLEQDKLRKIEVAMKDMKGEDLSIRYNISLKTIPAYQILSLRKIIPDYFCEGMLWQELTELVESNSIRIPQNSLNFAIYHDTDFKEADVDVEVCVAVQELGESKDGFTFRETEPVETMACAMVYGPYQNIGPAYEAFAHWLTQHNQYKMIGQNRQICHCGPWNEENPQNYLTEIQIPVTSSHT
ncbi:MerR family transcriptional regulator [Sinanaerobacter chloroacetimidivorans]|uniref:MerR family transcriptional regulator n=1 Tax=Sinanaerobacter chloroacetimidivorans TaxID=2818044 RepID=A0A8J8B5T7_9FIRM|nr:MerR family transcriptional regulator [Sinanaerobacter chloroacetimidivorans]MBR0600640.1 MerR family transcriptional regulator [Sinanaerobacter chloroacetimidivorans]